MKWTSVILKAAGALLAVLILYVLSYGPVYGYAMYSYIKRPDEKTGRRLERAETVYAPILWISERHQAIGRIGSQYAFFFINHVFKEDPLEVPPLD